MCCCTIGVYVSKTNCRKKKEKIFIFLSFILILFFIFISLTLIRVPSVWHYIFNLMFGSLTFPFSLGYSLLGVRFLHSRRPPACLFVFPKKRDKDKKERKEKRGRRVTKNDLYITILFSVERPGLKNIFLNPSSSKLKTTRIDTEENNFFSSSSYFTSSSILTESPFFPSATLRLPFNPATYIYTYTTMF